MKKIAKMWGNLILSRKLTGGINNKENSQAKAKGMKTTRAKYSVAITTIPPTIFRVRSFRDLLSFSSSIFLTTNRQASSPEVISGRNDEVRAHVHERTDKINDLDFVLRVNLATQF